MLGPIAAWSDGRSLPVGGPRQRCVLGVLLVYAGREVTFDQLISYLWNDDPPRTARSVIQVQISHLRRSFPGLIKTTSGGYLADLDPDRIDLHRFRRLRGSAQGVSSPDVLTRLSKALESWRGVPFSGVGSEHLLYSVVSPMLEERWAAVAEWAGCALELGRAKEVVAYLTPIARQEELRERIHHLLITALWRSGERAAALSAYEAIRSRLAEELGVDPDPELMALHTQILRADTIEKTPAKGTRPLVLSREDGFVVRNDLPRDIPDFAGRENSLAKVLGLAAHDEKRAKVCVITGTGGVGKTTVAVRAGHELADEYTDGQLFIDLYGYTLDKEPLDPHTALGALLRAVGVDPDEVPESLDERSALWRATLMGRRVLTVLDNAVTYSQVAPLLAASPGSLTLVTSRNDLSGLSGARYISLNVLEKKSSLELFARVLGEDKVIQEPEEAQEVARLCGGLPLALRVVAGRMMSRPRWTFAHVVRRLSEQNRQFRELQVDGQSVESAIDLSYRSLNPELHRTFLLLSAAFGRNIDLHGAAALLDLSPVEADEVLQDLVSVCLLDEPHADVYRLHDLIHVFASQRGRTDIGVMEFDRARQAHADYFTVTTDRAAELLGGPRKSEESSARTSRYSAELTSREAAEEWFELHQDHVAEVVDYFAAQERAEDAWRLADSTWKFYTIRGRAGMILSLHERVLAANDGSGHERGRAVTLIGMGIAYCISGHFDRSLELLTEAKSVLEVVDDEWGMFRALSNLAMVYERVGRFREAAEAIESLLGHKIAVSDPKVTALQWANLAILKQALGEHGEAIQCAENSISSAAQNSLEETRTYATRVMGEALVSVGQVPQALKYLGESLNLAVQLRLVGIEIFIHNSFGIAYRAVEKWDEAVAEHYQALDLALESGDRSGDAEILVELGVTLSKAQRHVEASQRLERALVLAVERDERYIAARASAALGRLPGPLVKPDRARELLTEALRTFEELDLPEVAQTREALQELDG
ncbi:putative transcriptional regulator [Nocardiopsis sp. JB363]|nr:putative transcriptional regulator [Nocardiopsis sp. JB363]